MATEVRLVAVEETPTAVVCRTTTFEEFPALWGSMLDSVWDFLRSAPPELSTQGYNVMLYKDDVPNVEVGVQVTGPFEPSGDVMQSHLPGGMAATAVHSGPMHLIRETHDAIRVWCVENGHRVDGSRWEVYSDPNRSTGDIAVEVYWSVLPD